MAIGSLRFIVLLPALSFAWCSMAADVNDMAAREAAVQQHVLALERSGDQDPQALLETFERERFSAAYLAETTRDERSALLAEIAAAAAQAGGIMVDAVGDDIHLV
ncbi:MAG: hypothetical protein WBN23_07915, partial [Woeseia sp.]